MHDSPEYLTGDLSRGFKQIPAIRDALFPIDSFIHYLLAERFGFRAEMPPSVKLADDRVCLTEMRDLFDPPRGNSLLMSGIVPLPEHIYPWGWELAEWAFLERFAQLFEARE